jgi:hypothetical protein
MSSDVNRRRLPGNGLIGVRFANPGMEHPLLTDAGGRLSGAFPNGVVPSWNVGPPRPEARLVVPIKFRTTRLAARKGQGPHRFD